MVRRQVVAAICRSGEVNSNCTSFSASANVAAETSGPTGGLVPKAEGEAGGNSDGCCGWARPLSGADATSNASELAVRNSRRDVDMAPPTGIVAGTATYRVRSRTVAGEVQPDAKTPGLAPRRFQWQNCSLLEQIPQELVVNIVMILDFRGLHEGPQKPRAAVGGGLLQVGIPAFHVFAKQLRSEE